MNHYENNPVAEELLNTVVQWPFSQEALEHFFDWRIESEKILEEAFAGAWQVALENGCYKELMSAAQQDGMDLQKIFGDCGKELMLKVAFKAGSNLNLMSDFFEHAQKLGMNVSELLSEEGNPDLGQGICSDINVMQTLFHNVSREYHVCDLVEGLNRLMQTCDQLKIDVQKDFQSPSAGKVFSQIAFNSPDYFFGLMVQSHKMGWDLNCLWGMPDQQGYTIAHTLARGFKLGKMIRVAKQCQYDCLPDLGLRENYYGDTPVDIAAKERYLLGVFQDACECGVNIAPLLGRVNQTEFTPLMMVALRENLLSFVETAIQHGINLEKEICLPGGREFEVLKNGADVLLANAEGQKHHFADEEEEKKFWEEKLKPERERFYGNPLLLCRQAGDAYQIILVAHAAGWNLKPAIAQADKDGGNIYHCHGRFGKLSEFVELVKSCGWHSDKALQAKDSRGETPAAKDEFARKIQSHHNPKPSSIPTPVTGIGKIVEKVSSWTRSL